MTASLVKFNDISARLAWKHSVWRYDARGARYFNAGGRYSLKWAIDKF